MQAGFQFERRIRWTHRTSVMQIKLAKSHPGEESGRIRRSPYFPVSVQDTPDDKRTFNRRWPARVRGQPGIV